MATVIFTAGTKGGTGKTFGAGLLTAFLREEGYRPMLLDMDDESRSFNRFFPEAELIEIDKTSSHDVLVERTDEGADLIIADLKAGTGRDTLKWWLYVPFDELPNIKFICVASITNNADSVSSFMNWAAELKDKVSYVVLMNCKDGETFTAYNESKDAMYFRKTYKPLEIEIPRLEDEYMNELDKYNITIADVVATVGNPSAINGKPVGKWITGIMKKARLRRFQNDVYDQFDPILELIAGN